MSRLFITQLSLTLSLVLAISACAQSDLKDDNTSERIDVEVAESSSNELFIDREEEFGKQKTKAKNFLQTHNKYNQELVFLLDMRLPSQNYRFFVLDIDKDSIVENGLVAHGSGSVMGDSLVFSNIPESYQSSIGNYKVGAKYTGSFGKSYKLHGLDKTNNNAFKRYIVLHPYSCVPDEEQDDPICESLGCAMVSDNFMNTLYGIIDSSNNPILMVMYY